MTLRSERKRVANGRKYCAVVVAALMLISACGSDDAADSDEVSPSSDDVSPSSAVGPGVSDEAITIGFHGPLTGPASWVGLGARDGALLAINEINEDGGINGRMLELEVQDDEGDPATATRIVRDFTLREDTFLVFSAGLSTPTAAGAAAAREAGIPYYNNLAGDPSAQEPWAENVFAGLALPAPSEGAAILEQYVVRILEAGSIAVIAGDDGFNTTAREGVVEAAESNGIEIVADVGYRGGDTEFGAPAIAVSRGNPDAVVLLALAAEAPGIISALRNAGYDGPIVGATGTVSNSLLELGADGENFFGAWRFGGYFTEDSGPMADFLSRWSAAYPSAPEGRPTYIDAAAYVEIYVIAEALRQAEELTWPGLIESLRSNITDFDPHGLSPRTFRAGDEPSDHVGGNQLRMLELEGNDFRVTDDVVSVEPSNS